MKEGIKIVTIGGGSSYTPELVEGFIKRHYELPVKELWLVDIPEGKEKLEIVGKLAQRMAAEAGIDMAVHLSYSREEALPGADFVTTQFRVGMLEARAKDERIPLSYGVIGQETNGPGGLFKGLRTIPIIIDIVHDIERLCPDAWLVNFTNPAGMVTEAVLRYTNHERIVGLCNVPVGMQMGVAEALGVDGSRVRIDFAGLNHMVYGLNIYLDGQDIKQQALEAVADPANVSTMKNIAALGWEPDFIRALQVLPCPYHRYYYKTEEMLAEELEAAKEAGTRAEVVQGVEEELFALYADETLRTKPEQLEQRGGAYYSEAACSLINSIYNDTRDIQPVNTRNRGAITGIPAESAVEISSVITKEGPRPVAVGELPVAVQGLVQQIKSFERVAAEAAVTGSYQTALLAMTINPLVPSDTKAKHMLDDMLEAHREHLPQFFQTERA
ncbi:6-phospho-beta-glucosidase [Marinococcus luteus]|uniref:6-phospho-beta-glucosidase n=1 Tax=Marinococcus luteus TaxID=1122204 RepID=UPI002ACCBF94|nr:6-phospho-beta-glucosidase [Marinococcus luteus]MDZ5782661.1 6-phospho-beta-glucosidase [Marinococcus luteus]